MFFSSSMTRTRGGVGTASLAEVGGLSKRRSSTTRLLSLTIHLQQEILGSVGKGGRRILGEHLFESGARFGHLMHLEVRLAEKDERFGFEPRSTVRTQGVGGARDGGVELVALQ